MVWERNEIAMGEVHTNAPPDQDQSPELPTDDKTN